MFRMRLTVNREIIETLRELPERAQRNLRRRLVTELPAELQPEVDALMSESPGPVSDPFVFENERSRLYYLILVRENPELTDGEHWIRTGTVEGGFRVKVSDRFRENQVVIRNIQPASRFVYGPRQVPGHAITGWGKEFEIARELLRERVMNRIIDMWVEAVEAAEKGIDL